jgi:hypothetical protein
MMKKAKETKTLRTAKTLYSAMRRAKMKQGTRIWGNVGKWEHQPSETQIVWIAVARAARNLLCRPVF